MYGFALLYYYFKFQVIEKLEYAAMLRVNANNCTVIISLDTTKMIAGILFAELVSPKYLHVDVSFHLIVLFSN